MSVAIDAMLDELDPYTVYYPESRIEDLRFMNTGEYGGIGALVQPIDGKTTIIEVYEGYPAQEAGIATRRCGACSRGPVFGRRHQHRGGWRFAQR